MKRHRFDPEARQEYEALLSELQKACSPADAVEAMLVEDMAVARWRMAAEARSHLGAGAANVRAGPIARNGYCAKSVGNVKAEETRL